MCSIQYIAYSRQYRIAGLYPDDLKAVWEINHEVQMSHSGERVGIGISVLEHACKPRADVKAVAYRAMNLGLLTLLFQQKLVPWLAPWIKADRQLDDAIFRIGARIEMEWIEVGVLQNSVPFDMNEFRRLLDGNQTKCDWRSGSNEPLRSRRNKKFSGCSRPRLPNNRQQAVLGLRGLSCVSSTRKRAVCAALRFARPA